MNHQKYKAYSVEELADDADFRAWALNPTTEREAFWQAAGKDEQLAKKITAALPLVVNIHRHYSELSPDRTTPDPNFAQLLTNIVRLDQAEQKAKLPQRKISRRWAVAASLAFLLGLGTWWATQSPTQVAENWLVHQTDFGEWKKVTLPDGSLVHLNAKTELKLSANWEEGQDRKVWLEGEAFFEVAKKPSTKAKFAVVTNALEVEVLGTMFNVNAKGENTKVFLEEGKIQLKTPNQSLALKPNDFIDYTLGQKELAITNQPIATSWKDGTLLLTKKTVGEILKRLEEIYGYTFKVEQTSLLSDKKTLAVPLDKLEVMLPILERTLGVDSELVDGVIVLTPN